VKKNMCTSVRATDAPDLDHLNSLKKSQNLYYTSARCTDWQMPRAIRARLTDIHAVPLLTREACLTRVDAASAGESRWHSPAGLAIEPAKSLVSQ
jgi:hypothetical protein